MENLEKRYVQNLRADGESRTISGTAIVFDVPSQDLGGFTEYISRTAVDDELINTSDIVFLFNHNEELVPLARSKNGKGSLRISITDTGVDFTFQVKKTNLGDEVLEAVRNGDLDSCSFAFAIDSQGEKWEKVDEKYVRTITKISYLRDFSIVTFPAYTQTSVNTRGLELFKEQEQVEVREEVVQPEVEVAVEEVKNPIDEYYENLFNRIEELKK